MLETRNAGGEIMGKYSTKTTDEEGNVVFAASDGSMFKSSGAAHKHSTKLEDEAFEAEEATKVEEKEAPIGGLEGQTEVKTPIEEEESSFQ